MRWCQVVSKPTTYFLTRTTTKASCQTTTANTEPSTYIDTTMNSHKDKNVKISFQSIILFLLFLIGTSYAFAPLCPRATSDASRLHRSFLSSVPVSSPTETDQQTGTLPETTKSSSTSSSLGVHKNVHRLELDHQGNLRLDDTQTVLLNGLKPSMWTASRPLGDEKHSSLFLHTCHSKECAEHESSLGDLVACRRLLACSRVTRYWMGPKVGTSAKDVPFDTQFLLIEIQQDGPYALLLPLVDNGFRASLHYGGGSIEVTCAAESGDAAVKCSGMRALYVGVGDDPYQLIKDGFAQVAQATGTFDTLHNKKLPPSVDEFGWCTWDAFYSKVTPEGVIQGVESLRNAGVPPKTLILDDGWQQVSPPPPEWEEKETAHDNAEKEKIGVGMIPNVDNAIRDAVQNIYNDHVRKAKHGSLGNRIWSFLSKTVLKQGLWKFFDTHTDFNRQLSGFSANHKFETTQEGGKTLKGLVSELKSKLGVKHVWCWHALHGYWRGVSPELGKAVGINVTNVHPTPSKSLLQLEPQLEWDPVSLFGVGLLSTEPDLAKFYKYLHTALTEAGVDGVKV